LISATGGTLPYVGTGILAAHVGSNSYIVVDSNGCTSATNLFVQSNNPPTITTLSTSTACIGEVITIFGSGFNTITGISFNNVTATNYIILNDSIVQVTIPVNSTTGALTLSNSNNCSFSYPNFTIICYTELRINLTLYLQGYYIGSGTMQPVLLNQLVQGATTDETDTIQVELYDAVTFNLVGASKSLLKSNGNCFASIAGTTGNYYIAIRHRNSICAWTSLPIYLSLSSIADFDFSSSPNQSFAGWLADDYSDGVYSLFSGDINQDEYVDASDYPFFDSDNSNGTCCGYHSSDLNGDGFVDASDYPLFDGNNTIGVFSIHP
jgi:hypothetical protein